MTRNLTERPYFYSLFLLFSFFFSLSCQTVVSPSGKSSLSGFPNLVLHTKSVKKWNPRFYEEGSAYHSFVEVNFQQESGKVLRYDFSLASRDSDFLKSTKSIFPKSQWKKYHLQWKLREGILGSNLKPDLLELEFRSVSHGDAESDDLPGLFRILASKGRGPAEPISEKETFRITNSSQSALLEKESIVWENKHTLEWTYDYGALDSFQPSGSFETSPQGKSSLAFQSAYYDGSTLRYEIATLDPSKFFIKSFWKTPKLEIFYVPNLANSPNFKSMESVDSKRFGNFLIKEETL